MSSPPQAPLVPSATGLIETDAPCKRCGYNLRGLLASGRCPECFTPVGLSIRGDLLCFSNPEWVETVARGLSIILWMILGGILASILAGMAGVAGGPLLGNLVGFAAALVSFYGVWLMTTPDPSGVGEDPNLTARKIVRITLVIGMLAPLLQIAGSGDNTRAVRLLLGGTTVIVGLVGLVGEFAKFMYYERLALRIPDSELAGRARVLRWGMAVSLGVVAVGGGLMLLAAALGGPAGVAPVACVVGLAVLTPVACVVGLAVLALLVFSVLTLFMLVRLRRGIREQAFFARQLWQEGLAAASDPPPAGESAT